MAIYGASLLGMAGMIWSLATTRTTERLAESFPRQGWAVLNLGMNGLLTLMWLGRIRMALNDEPGILLGETTLTVQALDLGLMVPISVLSAVLVLRRVEIGVGLLLSAWAVEGTLEVPPVAIFGGAALASLVLLIRTYRPPTGAVGETTISRPTTPAPIG